MFGSMRPSYIDLLSEVQNALREPFSKETSCVGPAQNMDTPEFLGDVYVMRCFDLYVGFCLQMLIFKV